MTSPHSSPHAAADSSDSKAAQLRAIERSGWGRSFVLSQPHNLAFWVYLVLVAFGTWSLLREWSRDASGNAVSLLIASLYFAAYAAAFLTYIRHSDRYQSEPWALYAVALVWGGTAATFGLSVRANDALSSIYAKAFGFAWSNDWAPGTSAPLTEELAKAAGVVLIITLAPRLVRTAFDGAVVGACVGLGFQVVESITYVMGDSSGSDVVNTLILRSITGLFSHVVYTAIMGMGIVWLWGRPDEPRQTGRGLAFVVAPVLLHAGWNTMKALGDRSGIYGDLAPLIVSVASLAVLFAGLRVAAVREREWMRDLLVPEVERGTVTPEELDAVSGPRRSRRTFAKAAEHRSGRRRRRAVFDATIDLAEQIARDQGDETPAVDQARENLATLRDAALT